jgi:hypothetical protein
MLTSHSMYGLVMLLAHPSASSSTVEDTAGILLEQITGMCLLSVVYDTTLARRKNRFIG